MKPMIVVALWAAWTACLLPDSAGRSADMPAAAAQAWLGSLSPGQRRLAQMPFDSSERLTFYFVPRARAGLSLEAMSEAQRRLASDLLRTALNSRGMEKAEDIRSLELVLREVEQRPAGDRYRHPELYYLSIFGQPGQGSPWAWRFEGHHLSLSFTLSPDSGYLAVSPAFWGANPAEVRAGSRQGHRALRAEEEMGRALLGMLGEAERARAVLPMDVPAEIVTLNHRKALIDKMEGIAYAALSPRQQEALRALVETHLAHLRPELAEAQRKRIGAAGWDKLHFAWVGSPERGQAHYYRIHGPVCIIEYDNVQNEANHIHCVWRDPENDFGDLLLKHYETGHRH